MPTAEEFSVGEVTWSLASVPEDKMTPDDQAYRLRMARMHFDEVFSDRDVLARVRAQGVNDLLRGEKSTVPEAAGALALAAA